MHYVICNNIPISKFSCGVNIGSPHKRYICLHEQVFNTEEETGIPALRQSVLHMTDVQLQRSAEHAVKAVGQFVFALRSYLSDEGTKVVEIYNNDKRSYSAMVGSNWDVLGDILSI